MHAFKSHFQQDFLLILAYCTWPVSRHLAMPCIGCSFNSFSVFLLSLKQQQNLMKIMFSCIHFPIWPYPPKIMKKKVFYTGKLYGLTGITIRRAQRPRRNTDLDKFSQVLRGSAIDNFIAWFDYIILFHFFIYWPFTTKNSRPVIGSFVTFISDC